jgi:hypothetical protein
MFRLNFFVLKVENIGFDEQEIFANKIGKDENFNTGAALFTTRLLQW